MDWENDNEMIIDKSYMKLPIEEEMAIMHHIFCYFQDSEINGTMANLNYTKGQECKCICSQCRDSCV